MMHVFRRAWSDVVSPIWHGSKLKQVAALCYRETDAGKGVLLITSRDTGRWIIPKGWPMKGKTAAEAAVQEAWEEAGVRDAEVEAAPIGAFEYVKRRRKNGDVMVRADVYPVRVTALQPAYPEVSERARAWFSQAEAAALVDEAELKTLITAL